MGPCRRKKSQAGGGRERLWKGRGRKTEWFQGHKAERKLMIQHIMAKICFGGVLEFCNLFFFSGISELFRHSFRAEAPPRGCFFRCLRQTEVCAHPRGSTPLSRDAQTVLAACWWSHFLCGSMQWMCRVWLVHISLSQIAQAKEHSHRVNPTKENAHSRCF